MNINRFAALAFICLIVTSVFVSALPFPESIDTSNHMPGDDYDGSWMNNDGNGFIISKEKDGSWKCEGLNTRGQCNIPPELKPDDVLRVEAGYDFVVALLKDGTVRAWGDNDHGQCDVPYGLSDVTQVAVTGDSVAVILKDGTVRAWGNNHYNQTRVPSLDNARFISSGTHHYAVLTEDGNVVTWGDNSFGQCTIPHDLLGKKVISVTTGGYHNVALTDDGMVYAWGNNSRGQCNIPKNAGVVHEISAGEDYSHIYLENRTILVCGSRSLFGGESRPISIPSISGTNFNDFDTGVHENIAITESGEVLVWPWDTRDLSFDHPENNYREAPVSTPGNFSLKRVSDKNILNHPARTFIYEKISSSPGIHFNDLCRDLGINRGTLHHHLYALISSRKIVEMVYAGKTVYFANNGQLGDPERKLLTHLKNPARRDLLQILHTHGQLRRGELIDYTRLSTPAAAWHLKFLSNEGIVRIEKSGREAYYSLHPDVEPYLGRFSGAVVNRSMVSAGTGAEGL
ncbi:MAG: ArsR family transcriptional regulator [Methanoregula sp.]|nr:ArsR family transcriptional regulator [Methanoregula sp.]